MGLILLCLFSCQPGEKAILQDLQRDTAQAQSILDSTEVRASDTYLLVRLVNDAPAELAVNPTLQTSVQRINKYAEQVALDQSIIGGYLGEYQTLQSNYANHKTDLSGLSAALTDLRQKVQDYSKSKTPWRSELNQIRADYSNAVQQALEKK